jgi:hypothetical protein
MCLALGNSFVKGSINKKFRGSLKPQTSPLSFKFYNCNQVAASDVETKIHC